VLLTFVLTPSVRWLRRRGITESIGAALVVTALIGVTALLGATLSSPVARWIERAPETMTRLIERIDRLREAIPVLAPPRAAAPTAARVASRSAPLPGATPPPEPAPQPDPIKDKITSKSMELTGDVLGGTLTFTITALATVILLYFLLASEYWMLSRTVEAIPRRRARALVLSGVRAAQSDIGRYLGVMAVINLGVGSITGLAMWGFGLDSPVLWGTLAFAFNFIPYIGPLIMSTLLLVAGLLSFDSSAMMLAPPAAFLAIHFVEANLLTPNVLGVRLSLSPVAVFLSVMLWAWMWGIAGAVIAVPLLVAFRSVCKRNRRWRLLCVYLEGAKQDAPSLRSLMRTRRRAPLLQREQRRG
jgi:predicted PurR-regulated permease PerM